MIERIVPTVMEVIRFCCKTVEVPAVVPGTMVVEVLKNGTSSPTFIRAV